MPPERYMQRQDGWQDTIAGPRPSNVSLLSRSLFFSPRIELIFGPITWRVRQVSMVRQEMSSEKTREDQLDINLVELGRFELPTSSVQGRRSPN